MSKNFSFVSANSTSGCSYISHMIFAASIGEPPPRAMIVSGRNSRISAAPARTVASSGLGSTLSMICTTTGSGRACRMSVTRRTKPSSPIVRSVTTVTRSSPGMVPRYWRALRSK